MRVFVIFLLFVVVSCGTENEVNYLDEFCKDESYVALYPKDCEK